MQRMINMVVGLTVVTVVAVVMLGSMGEGSKSGGDGQGSRPRSGLPQLDEVAGIVGPASSRPPPIPTTARFAVQPAAPALAALLAAPDDPPPAVIEARWRLVEARLVRVFGPTPATAQRDAIYAALVEWLRAQLRSAAAYHGGYIDRQELGRHAGWNRYVYLQVVQAALTSAEYQGFAGDGQLDEVNPTLP